MKLKCLIKGHLWMVGRVADRESRHLVDAKSYHNRACGRCGKEEWNADEVEAEAERIRVVREMLHETRRVARIKEMDPKLRPIDPHEFP